MKKNYLSILMIVLATGSAFSQNKTSIHRMASQKDIATITEVAKSKFNVTINSKRVVYDFQADGSKITAAPILSSKVNTDGWQNIGVVTVAPGKEKSGGHVLASGNYILQYNGAAGRYVDNKGETVSETPASTSVAKIRIKIGWLTINGPCVCWKDKNGQDHCICPPIVITSPK